LFLIKFQKISTPDLQWKALRKTRQLRCLRPKSHLEDVKFLQKQYIRSLDWKHHKLVLVVNFIILSRFPVNIPTFLTLGVNPFVCTKTVVKHALVWRPEFPFRAVKAEQPAKWRVAYSGYGSVRMIRYTRRLFKLYIFSTKNRVRLV